MSNFFKELERRHVIKATIAYLVISWIIIQVALAVLPSFGAPAWVIQAIIIALAVGLPIWIVISWIYNIVPQGFEKTAVDDDHQVNKEITNKRLNVFIIVSLSIAVIVMGLKISGLFSSNSKNQYAIAVLPFVNMSNDSEQEYFSDGISEEIINMLAQVPNLKVMGRTSSFAFKGKNMDMKEIGKLLNVNYLLEGSVRRYDNTLRITAQLINVADGSHVYSDKFDREVKDIFDIQDEISQDILNAIEIKLLRKEKDAVLKKYTENTDAYELYLRGLFYVNKFTPDGFLKAIEYFDKAIAIDPNYAIAYAQLTFCYTNLLDFNWGANEDLLPKAKAAAKKSLELDDQISESHMALGRIKLHQEWNVRDAIVEYKKALAINPNSADAHIQLGFCLAYRSQCEEAMKQADIAESLDPLSLLNIWYLTVMPWRCHDYETVLANGKKLIDMEPNFFGGHLWAGGGYLGMQRYDKAIAEFEQTVKLNPGTWTLGMLGEGYGLAGDTLKAKEVIDRMKDYNGYDRFANTSLGDVYSAIGVMDSAFYYYNRALKYHEGQLLWVRPKNQDDPRWDELFKKMNVIH